MKPIKLPWKHQFGWAATSAALNSTPLLNTDFSNPDAPMSTVPELSRKKTTPAANTALDRLKNFQIQSPMSFWNEVNLKWGSSYLPGYEPQQSQQNPVFEIQPNQTTQTNTENSLEKEQAMKDAYADIMNWNIKDLNSFNQYYPDLQDMTSVFNDLIFDVTNKQVSQEQVKEKYPEFSFLKTEEERRIEQQAQREQLKNEMRDKEWQESNIVQKPLIYAKNNLQDFWKSLKIEWKLEKDNNKYDPWSWDSFKKAVWNSTADLWNALRFAANLPWDAIQWVWELWEVVAHPLDTAKWAYNLASAWVAKVWVWEDTEEKKQIRENFSKVIDENFWSMDRFMNTVETNPFDTLSTVFGIWAVTKTWLNQAKNIVWKSITKSENKIAELTEKMSTVKKWTPEFVKIQEEIAKNTKSIANKNEFLKWLDSKITKTENFNEVVNPINQTKASLYVWKKAVESVAWKAWDAVSSIFWMTTWTWKDTIKNAVKYWWEKEYKDALSWKMTQEDILNKAKEAFNTIKEQRKEIYWADYEKLKLNKNNIDINDIKDNFKNYLDDMRVEVVPDEKWWYKLDFSQSNITQAKSQTQIKEMMDDLWGWRDTTPEWLDILKQRVQDRYLWTEGSNKSDILSTKLSNEIKNKIVAEVPEYAEMTKKYETLSNELREIDKVLSLSDSKSKMTALTRLNQTLKNNTAFRKEMLEKLEELSGMNLKAAIAWSNLSDWKPAWILSTVWTAWLWYWVASGMTLSWIVWLASMSPKIIWQFAKAIWTTTKTIRWAIKTSGELLKKFPEVFGRGWKAWMESKIKVPEDRKFFTEQKKVDTPIKEIKLPNRKIPYSEWIEWFFKWKLNSDRILSINRESDVLKDIYWEWDFILKQRVIRNKAIQHWLTYEDIKWLDKAINEPIFVYKSWTKHKADIIITDLSKWKDKIAVAIWTDINWKIEFWDIKSIHPKEFERLLNETKEGKIKKILFEDTKKIQDWTDSASSVGKQSDSISWIWSNYTTNPQKIKWKWEETLKNYKNVSTSNYKNISNEAAETTIKKYFWKEVWTEFLEKIKTSEWFNALWKYKDKLISFAKNPKENVVEHEALHAYFDLALSKNQKKNILNQIKIEKKFKTDLDAEEWLADSFADFVINRRNVTWVSSAIKKYISDLWYKFQSFFWKWDKVEWLFRDLENIWKGKKEFKLSWDVGKWEKYKIIDLNDWRDLELLRWTWWKKWNKNNWAWEAIRGKGLYLTDELEVAKHYWDNIKKYIVKNEKILDADNTIFDKKTLKKIEKSLPEEYKNYLDFDDWEYTYSKLLNAIEWNTWIEAEEISEKLNNILKWDYKWLKYRIWNVNDTLEDIWLWDNDALLLFNWKAKEKYFIDNTGMTAEEAKKLKNPKWDSYEIRKIKRWNEAIKAIKKNWWEKIDWIDFSKMPNKYKSLYDSYEDFVRKIEFWEDKENVSIYWNRSVLNRVKEKWIRPEEHRYFNWYWREITNRTISKKDAKQIAKEMRKELDEISNKYVAKIQKQWGKSAEEITFEKIKEKYKEKPEEVLAEALYNLNKEAKKIRDKRTELKENLFWDEDYYDYDYEFRPHYNRTQRANAHEKLQELYDEMDSLYVDKDKYIKKIIDKFGIKPKWYHEFDSWDLMDYYEFWGRWFHMKENKSKNNLWAIEWEISSAKEWKKMSLPTIYKVLNLLDDEELNKILKNKKESPIKLPQKLELKKK